MKLAANVTPTKKSHAMNFDKRFYPNGLSNDLPSLEFSKKNRVIANEYFVNGGLDSIQFSIQAAN